MKRLRGLEMGVVAALGLLACVFAVRVARHFPGARLEMGRARLSRLTEETRRRLSTLQDRVLLTYYASDRSRMPSHLRGVEREVTDLFDALKRASGGKLDYQVVDPDADPVLREDLSRYAAKRAVAPFRARSVERDAWSETTVWSTISIAYGPRPESAIPGVGPERLERLQGLLVEHLDQMERPRKARIAVAAPAGYEQLAAFLAGKGEVARVDLDGGAPFPEEADALFWMHPRRVDDERLAEMDRFVRRGRNVLVAGSERSWEARRGPDGAPWLVVKPTPYPAQTLLAHYGLRAASGLLCDLRGEAPAGAPGAETRPAFTPFLVRCIATDQDFRAWRNQPNGNLLFEVPTPFALDPEALEERGWRAEVLATSSDKSWVQPVPREPIPFAEVRPENGEAVPKQLLMVRLRTRDPWQGAVILCAASTPFRDGYLQGHEGVAHERLARVLADAFTANDRLVLARAGSLAVEPLPAMGAGARALWRGWTVLFLPAALLALALLRGAFSVRVERAPRLAAGRALLAAGLLGALAAGLLARAAGALGARADLSEFGRNELSRETRAIAARATEPIEAEIVFSSPERLPPSMRRWGKRVAEALGELRRAGARLSVRSVDPDDLGEAGRKALAAEGIEPFKATTKDEETTTVRTVYAALRLASRGRSETLRFPDAVSIENLEFRLAFALWRLETGRRPLVAFASDAPRLSPAEAWDLQQAGFTPPSGTDVYGVARGLLEGCDFRVAHVNPRDPRPPENPDAFVWLQPRRDVSAAYDWLARYLHRGGRAFLAAQHFNVQARQFRGTGFKLVYWPQPQFPDVDLLYFPDLGIEVVREVLFDELKTRIAGEAQVNRSYARPDLEVQTSALPFLIRASAANFSKDSPLTRELGDQAFLWGAYVRTDEEKLRAVGLRARPLLTTSERTWSFAWKGGYLPEELLAGPPRDEGGEPAWLGRVPLAVDVEGNFPEPFEPLKIQGKIFPGATSEPAATKPAFAATPPGPPGRLLLVGCSEMFKNHRVLDPEFRADHLLLNAVASLALPGELAEVAARRPAQRGFDYVEPGDRIRWRGIVLAGFPAALAAFGLVRAAARRRPTGVASPAQAAGGASR
ncbi:MAG: GldG family protein [Planctomycetes bacterium]|nr:GldG family protein [Planctomycetota bacterium]